MRKRILSILTCICLVITMVPSSFLLVGAAGEENWAELKNRDTSWTDGAISTPQQLAQFAYLVNEGTYAGENHVWLTNDIDLGGKQWTAIGNVDDPDLIYTGLFDGKNYTVKNMTMTDIEKEFYDDGLYSLFGVIEGTVQNVTVTGNITCYSYSQWYYLSGVAAFSYGGKIINCINEVDIHVETSVAIGGSRIGGIIAGNYGEVIYCVNNGDIFINRSNSVHTGGIAGSNTGLIDRCENNGNIKGNGYVGGVASYMWTDTDYYPQAKITNCINNGIIEDTDNSYYSVFGGVVGYISGGDSLIKNVYNTGHMVDDLRNYGNIAGELRDASVINAYYLENNSYGVAKVNNKWTDTNPTLDMGTSQTDTELRELMMIDKLNFEDNAFYFDKTRYPVLRPTPIPVTVIVSPTTADATLTVKQGDTEFPAESDGTYLLLPGDYKVTATSQKYVTKTEAFVLDVMMDDYTVNIELEAKPADYTKVDSLLQKIPEDLSIYTDESVAILLSAKEAVLRGKNIFDQTLVDDYALALDNAIKGLTLKTSNQPGSNKPTTPTDPTDPNKPTDSTKPGNSNELSNPTDSTTSTNENPQTGDTNIIWPLLVTMAFCGTVLVRRKKHIVSK